MTRARWRSRKPRRSNLLTLQTNDDSCRTDAPAPMDENDACGGELRRTSCATCVFVVRSSVDAGGFGVRLVRCVRTNANAWRVDAMLFASSSHETTDVDVACVLLRRRLHLFFRAKACRSVGTTLAHVRRQAQTHGWMDLLLLPPRVRSHPFHDVASSCLCLTRLHASRPCSSSSSSSCGSCLRPTIVVTSSQPNTHRFVAGVGGPTWAEAILCTT